MCKYLCLGIGSYPFFIVVVTNELICCRTRRAEDLNPSGQTGEQPEAIPGVETKPVDSTPESLGAQWFVEESTTTAGGVEGGERLATMVDDSVETLGATARAAESSEARAGAADVMPEFGA